MPDRRRFLLAAAQGLLMVQAGPGSAQQVTSLAGNPLAPWQPATAASQPDWRLRAAGWAVLAPNPHNRQPWLLELRDADTVVLRCDLGRRLPVTDPHDRQITIGLGAFAELFRMAAAEEGLSVAVHPFPEGRQDGRLDARPVALLRRLPGRAEADPLFSQTLARRSAKQPFDLARPVDDARLAALRAVAPGIATTATEAEVAPLRDLLWRAWMVEAEAPAAYLESVQLMRLGQAEVAAQPDGISLWGPALEPLVASGALTRQSLTTAGSQAQQMMIGSYRQMIAATPTVIWTTSSGDTKAAAFAAGRDWLRLNLTATALGLALHPVSQALQEYPEMAAPFAALHQMLGVAAPARLQMLGRVGFLPAGRSATATPRWPATSRIMGG